MELVADSVRVRYREILEHGADFREPDLTRCKSMDRVLAGPRWWGEDAGALAIQENDDQVFTR